MAVQTSIQPGLPQGVGRLTTGWKIFIAVSLAVLGFGLYAYWYQSSNGMVVTNLRNTGTMGEAIGLAAVVCKRQSCTPRTVYPRHWDELITLFATE